MASVFAEHLQAVVVNLLLNVAASQPHFDTSCLQNASFFLHLCRFRSLDADAVIRVTLFQLWVMPQSSDARQRINSSIGKTGNRSLLTPVTAAL